jgi:hypothetical protein
MKHKLSRISMVLSTSGMLAAGLASGAHAATTANAANAASTAKAVAADTPTWHTVLSVPNGTKQNLLTAAEYKFQVRHTRVTDSVNERPRVWAKID